MPEHEGPASSTFLEHPVNQPTISRWTLPVVLAGTFMTMLDFFIVNVAVPDTQRELHASGAAVQLIVAGYGLALAALLITGGRLGDIHGRRRMFLLGLGLFTVTSAICGLAPNTGILIAGRLLQGVAAALLTPQTLAIINSIYTGSARSKAFAAYGLTLGAAGVFGQVIGGLLIRGRYRRAGLAQRLPGEPAGRPGSARGHASFRT